MSARISSPVFIGRSIELTALRDAADAAIDGGIVPILVAGEAGVGKTRLIGELMTYAAERGMRVIRGGCTNVGDGGLPYGPIVEALRGLAHELDAAELAAAVGPNGPELVRLLPSLESERPAGQTVQTEWLQARLFEGLLGFLQRLAAMSPAVVILEDLHWSDPATREAVTFLIRGLRSDRILLAMTYRSDELHRRHPMLPWLAELERNNAVRRLEVRRLGLQETADLVAAISGTEPDGAEAASIHRRSDGNPFFIEELLASRREPGGSAGLPPTLRGILLARIGSVPEPTQAIVRVAAVIGQRVDHDALAAIVNLPEDVLLDGLRAAVSNQLLVIQAMDGAREDYAFRHALVQEAAYDDLLPGERRRLHRRCAETLASGEAGSGAAAAAHWASVAHHWSAAGDDIRAFDAALHAARAAEETFAFSAALRQYERALELWTAVPDAVALAGIDQPTLLGLAAKAANLIGETGRDVALRREALASLPSGSDPTRRAVMTEQLGRALWTSGDSERALAAYEQAVQIMPVEPPSPERARVLSGFAQMLMLLDRSGESLLLCDEAISIARLAGAVEAEGHALNTRGLDLVGEGRCTEGIESLEDALRIALEAHNADDIGRAYVNLLDAVYFCGYPRRAAEIADEGIRVADQYGIASSYGCFLRQGALFVHYDLGRWDVAGRLANEAESLKHGGIHMDRYGISRWAELSVATGAPEAAARLDRLWELIGDAPIEGQFSGPYHIARAELALWAGRPAEALDIVDGGVAALATIPWSWYLVRLHRVGARAAADLAEVARALRDPQLGQDASRRGNMLRADRERVFNAILQRQTGPARKATIAELATAVAEDTRLEAASDVSAWREALAAWRGVERPYLVGYVRWREAEACLATGDRSGAAEALSEAAAIAGGLGARPLLKAIESLAARARIRLTTAGPGQASEAEASTTSPADPFGLTPREREVLALLTKGWTNRQIAGDLFISENTAGVHVSHIIGKLDARGRTDAAAIAVRLGLEQTR